MSLNLRHLSYLVAAAENRSITDAASSLKVSQPAISAAIKSLEGEYGYQIFVRSPAQGLTPTSAGKQFIAHAQQMLDNSRDFDQQARGVGQRLSGEVQVGCYFITAPFLLPEIIGKFSMQHDDARVTLHETDLTGVIADLKSGTTDVAVTYDMYLDNAVTLERLYQVKPHVLLSTKDPLARKKAISLRDLESRPMLLLDLAVTQDYFLNFFHMHQLQPDVQYRLKSFEMIRSLVGANLGFSFGFLPLSIDQTWQGDKVVRKPLLEKVPHPWVCLAYSRQMRPTRLLDVFIQTIRDTLSKT